MERVLIYDDMTRHKRNWEIGREKDENSEEERKLSTACMQALLGMRRRKGSPIVTSFMELRHAARTGTEMTKCVFQCFMSYALMKFPIKCEDIPFLL